MSPQPGDDSGIFDEEREGGRRLQPRQQFAERAGQRGGAAGIGVERSLHDEIGDGDAACRVNVV